MSTPNSSAQKPVNQVTEGVEPLTVDRQQAIYEIKQTFEDLFWNWKEQQSPPNLEELDQLDEEWEQLWDFEFQKQSEPGYEPSTLPVND